MQVNETEVRVIYGDTDAMGIVYNSNYIKWFEVGRTEFLRDLGYSYSQMEEEGLWLPVGEAYCKYRTPARYDDVLVIRTWIKELKAATLIIGYEIIKKETEEVCVTGYTMHPVTDPELRPVRFKKESPELYELLKRSMKD